MVCNLDTHDPLCRNLCAGAGCVVAPVDYRLTPEHRCLAAPDDCLAATTSLLKRYGVAFVFAFRFIYGARNVAAAASGVAGMSRLRFALLNFGAAGLWAASFVGAGWYAAEWLGAENLGHAVGALGLAVLGALGLRFWTRRQRATVPAVVAAAS